MLQTANLRTVSQRSYYSLYNSVVTLHMTHRLKPNRRAKHRRLQVPFNGGPERFVTFRECFIKKPWTFPERGAKHWSQDEN